MQHRSQNRFVVEYVDLWSEFGYTHITGCLIFISHFPQKSPIIGGKRRRVCWSLVGIGLYAHYKMLCLYMSFPQKSPSVHVIFRKRARLYMSFSAKEPMCKEGIADEVSMYALCIYRIYMSDTCQNPMYIHGRTQKKQCTYTHSAQERQCGKVPFVNIVYMHI